MPWESPPDRSLRHIYWGAPLWSLDDLPALTPARELSSFDPRQMMENEEFPGWGGTRYYEPALKIVREDGDRDLVLQYVSHRIADHNLDISLKDIRDSVEVTLHYSVYPEHGIIRRSATIRNGTERTLNIESAQSAAWYMPAGTGYQLSYLNWPLGRRNAARAGADSRRHESAGEPQGPYQPRIQPVVRGGSG